MQTETLEYGEKVTKDAVRVWRALKGITEGEARKVINSVKSEDGFKAWWKLHLRFEPGLAAKHGLALAEFSGMVTRPAKTPAETKQLVTEMDRKMHLIDEITDEAVSNNHAKSVLIGILDPMTRQHTAMSQGGNITYENFKKVVLEFANNVSGGSDAMQIGRVGEEASHACGHAHEEDSMAAWESAWDIDENINGLGAEEPVCNAMHAGNMGIWLKIVEAVVKVARAKLREMDIKEKAKESSAKAKVTMAKAATASLRGKATGSEHQWPVAGTVGEHTMLPNAPVRKAKARVSENLINGRRVDGGTKEDMEKSHSRRSSDCLQ